MRRHHHQTEFYCEWFRKANAEIEDFLRSALDQKSKQNMFGNWAFYWRHSFVFFPMATQRPQFRLHFFNAYLMNDDDNIEPAKRK